MSAQSIEVVRPSEKLSQGPESHPLAQTLGDALIRVWTGVATQTQSPWNNPRYTHVRENFADLGPFEQRVVSTLEAFGTILPNCATLEMIARDTLAREEFDPEHAINIFHRFQEGAKKDHNPVLLFRQDIALAFTGAMDTIQQSYAENPKHADELDRLKSLFDSLPTIVYDSLGSGPNDRDPQERKFDIDPEGNVTKRRPDLKPGYNHI